MTLLETKKLKTITLGKEALNKVPKCWKITISSPNGPVVVIHTKDGWVRVVEKV